MSETKVCTKCGEAVPLDGYYLAGKRPSSWCKACFSRYDADKRAARKALRAKPTPEHLAGITKRCPRCECEKDLTAFAPAKTGRYNRAGWCRACKGAWKLDRMRLEKLATGIWPTNRRAKNAEHTSKWLRIAQEAERDA